jgi:hypothetical protein
MMISTILTTLFWATAVVASNSTGGSEQHSKSLVSLEQPVSTSQPPNPKPSASKNQPTRLRRRTLRPQNRTMAAKGAESPLGRNTNYQYSNNWAGATLIGSGFSSVTGTIVVPVPQEPFGAIPGEQYMASAWVGIDGDTCETAILQTGVDFVVTDGFPTYDAWFEWYPDVSYNFPGFFISAGDTITMTVTATSGRSGVATIENLSTGQTATHPFYSELYSLCGTNAEWIVEDASNGYGLVPFADFNSVTFYGASATSYGVPVGPAAANIMDIQQGGQVLTECYALGSTVSCTYR